MTGRSAFSLPACLFFLRGEYSGGGCLKLKANPYTGATEGEAKGMEHIRKFLRGKGFALALLACIAAAAAAGVWAVGTIRDQMARDLGESPSQNITGEETFPWHRPGRPAPRRRNSYGNKKQPAQPSRRRMCPNRARPAGLLVRRLGLVRCPNPPRCKPNRPLPARQPARGIRGPSLGRCSPSGAAMSWSIRRPWATGAPTTASITPASRARTSLRR